MAFLAQQEIEYICKNKKPWEKITATGIYKEGQQSPSKSWQEEIRSFIQIEKWPYKCFFAFQMYFHQWLPFKMFSIFSQNQIFLSDGQKSSNSHLEINYVLSASYFNYYVQHYFWNFILAYNFMSMVHQGERMHLALPQLRFYWLHSTEEGNFFLSANEAGLTWKI